MNNLPLQFRVAVNATREFVVNTLEKQFKDLRPFWETNRHIRMGNCIVEIRENEDYDDKLANNLDDGFLYYQHNIDVYPVVGEITLEAQIAFSKSIYSQFEKLGIKCAIVSGFEHLL